MSTDSDRYHAAAHAMQSGVALELEMGISEDATPKHLRVGINAAMVEHSALAKLLIDKGLITEPEYIAAIADGMEREQRSYEQRLSLQFNKDIKLG